MKNKKLKLLTFLLALITTPSVAAVSLNDMVGRVQDLLSTLPYYEQAATFIALLILFLVIFRIGATKMATQLN